VSLKTEQVARTCVIQVRGSFSAKAADLKYGGLRYLALGLFEHLARRRRELAQPWGVRLRLVISKHREPQSFRPTPRYPLPADVCATRPFNSPAGIEQGTGYSWGYSKKQGDKPHPHDTPVSLLN
jgi:hypothetical protein